MSEKKKILFVDDETRILDGLRRMLRSMRNEWEMSFAASGQEALDILAGNTFDVIVSDIRMPGINGAQLLNAVKQQYPQTVRIALSGQASKETILRSVGPIHQYLPKPCDAENLKNTITRVCSLRSLLTNEKMQGLISQLESLPCISSLYAQLMEEINSDDASINKIGEIISRDVGMSVKILQLVNSAFFGVPQRVSSIGQAVTLLGLDIIRALVLSIKIFSQFDQIKLASFSLSALWEHSLTVGHWAKLISRAENLSPILTDYAMIAGMLHDVGKLVLAAKMPQEYQSVLTRASEKNLALHRAEKELLGVTHAEVGAYLLGLWGFSHAIIEAVSLHHRPTEAAEKGFTALTAVYAANVLSHEAFPTDNNLQENVTESLAYLNEGDLAARLASWRELCRGKTALTS